LLFCFLENFVNPNRLALALAAALPCAFFSHAMAQTDTRVVDSIALSLGEVVVTHSGGPLATRNVLTSVNIIPVERIEPQVVTNNWQLFEQVPGVMLTPFGQGATSGKFSLRAFNGEGEINAVKLLIDGVPSNSNDGNMPYIDLAPRLDIEAIEVVRGTNDPRYGLHNIAGNANIITKRGGNYALGRSTIGSFGTQEVQTALGIEKDGFSQNYAIGYQTTNGHRDHSEAENIAFSGKWFLSSDNGKSRMGLIARHYAATAQEAGYLTGIQVLENPMQSTAHNSSDDDKRRTTQVAIQAETEVSERLFAAGQIYVNELDDRRFVRFSSAVSQQERYVAEKHIGAAANLTFRAGETAVGHVTVTGGIDTEHQDNRSERYNTTTQVRTSQTRDQQFDFNTTGAFVQAVIKPSAKLTITPAYRVDSISGNYTNLRNGLTYDVNHYGLIKQPKLSAVYAVSEPLAVYGNWGRSFQVGVGTASYKVSNTSDLAPSVNDGWEAGVKFKLANWVDGRLAVWRQTASNEARRKLNDPSNDAENIGTTRREGVDIELNARPSGRLNLWVAGSVQKSKILKADAASLATEGQEIDHVPHMLYNFGVDYRATELLRLTASANGQSSYFLERTNSTGKFGGYLLLNVSAAYQLSKTLSLDLQVRNLTNRYHEYVWHDGSQALHAPGAPRSVFASVTAKF